MSQIVQWWMAFSLYTKTNPVVAGVVSLWGVGLVTVIFRRFPAELGRWFYGQITTTLEFDNNEMGWSRENYAGFMAWYMKRKRLNFTRHFSLLSFGKHVEEAIETTGKTGVVGVGNGTHYFFYKRRLCKMTRKMIEKQGQNNTMFTITVTLFSRRRQLVEELVDEFCYKYDMEKQRLYRFGESGSYWVAHNPIRKRALKTVVVSPKLKRGIIKDIEEFRANRQWYYDRGFSYKKTFVLHGDPGGGKTSLIKAIAAHFGMHVGVINLADMTDSRLAQAFMTVPPNTIVLIEDFDSADAVKARHALTQSLKLKKQKADGEENVDADDSKPRWVEPDGLTLSGVLNALDGVVELDNVMIFMTTNVLQDIDPAVIRKGRVDKIYEVPALTHPEVVEYIELMFPSAIVGGDVRFAELMGCDLQAAYFEHPDSVYDFIGAIPKEPAQPALALVPKFEEDEYPVDISYTR
jgi:mitochondrial chaperone BCS1